jgi:flagellar protein FlgJ
MQRRGVMMPYVSQATTLDSSMEAAASALGYGPAKNWKPDSREDFVTELWPHAERAAQKLGVDPRVLVAQAALESGWGQHVMQHGNGHSSNNLFGIKADTRWDGDQVRAKTMEFRNGALAREQAAFRAYASPAESMADYADFITSNPRYQDAIGTADPQRYALELQRAGYATDPAYAHKIVSILTDDRFQDAVSRAQHRSQPAATEVQEISAVTQSSNSLIDAAPNRAGGN